MSVRSICIALLALVLAGCKIEIKVPEGGRVVSQSGEIEACEAGMTCTVSVVDIFFDETFVAEPADGMKFAGWEKLERGLCGDTMEPCHLFTSGFEGNPALMSFLETDEEVFFLNPTFEADDGGSAGEPICEYTQNAGPFSYEVCHTGQDESSCAGTYAGTLSSGSCTEGRDPGPAGMCATPDGDIYYYDHDASQSNYEFGCNFLEGTWTDFR